MNTVTFPGLNINLQISSIAFQILRYPNCMVCRNYNICVFNWNYITKKRQ